MCVDGSSPGAKRLDGVALRLLSGWTIRVQVDPWLDSSRASVWCLPSPPPPPRTAQILYFDSGVSALF